MQQAWYKSVVPSAVSHDALQAAASAGTAKVVAAPYTVAALPPRSWMVVVIPAAQAELSHATAAVVNKARTRAEVIL